MCLTQMSRSEFELMSDEKVLRGVTTALLGFGKPGVWLASKRGTSQVQKKALDRHPLPNHWLSQAVRGTILGAWRAQLA